MTSVLDIVAQEIVGNLDRQIQLVCRIDWKVDQNIQVRKVLGVQQALAVLLMDRMVDIDLKNKINKILSKSFKIVLRWAILKKKCCLVYVGNNV